MRYYFEKGLETLGITFAISFPIGWIDNVLSALIVAIFTFFILPMIDTLGQKFIAYLKTKGVSQTVAEKAKVKIQNYLVNELKKRIREAQKKGDMASADVLLTELDKLKEGEKQ